MRAGLLRHLVVIQTPTEVNDSQGQPVKSWATFATVHANVLPLKGREYFNAQQINAETTTKFVIRYLAGITPKKWQKMRISYDSEVYNIQQMMNVGERDRMIELLTGEGVNDG